MGAGSFRKIKPTNCWGITTSVRVYRGGSRKFYCCALYSRANSKKKSPPGGLYSEERFNGGFFALRFWGAYIWRGLYMEGLIFGILRYISKACMGIQSCFLSIT